MQSLSSLNMCRNLSNLTCWKLMFCLFCHMQLKQCRYLMGNAMIWMYVGTIYMLQSIFRISQSSELTEPTSQSIRLPDTTSQYIGLPKNISHSQGLPKKYFYFSHTLTKMRITYCIQFSWAKTSLKTPKIIFIWQMNTILININDNWSDHSIHSIRDAGTEKRQGGKKFQKDTL